MYFCRKERKHQIYKGRSVVTISYPADYSLIIEAMRVNIATLPASTQEYYQSSTEKVLNATTGGKISRLMESREDQKKTRMIIIVFNFLFSLSNSEVRHSINFLTFSNSTKLFFGQNIYL